MPPKTWKSVERRIARYLGTERTPLSGGNSRQTRSDTLHPLLYAEIKHGKRPWTWAAISRLWLDTAEQAGLEGKVPVVIIHRKGVRNVGDYDCYLVVVLARPDTESLATALVCVPLSTIRSWFPPSPPSIDARPGAEVKQATAGELGGDSAPKKLARTGHRHSGGEV